MHESEKCKWSRSVVSDSSRPHGLQPTRLPHPWDFPGKNTGVGCHCLLLAIYCWVINHANTGSGPERWWCLARWRFLSEVCPVDATRWWLELELSEIVNSHVWFLGSKESSSRDLEQLASWAFLHMAFWIDLSRMVASGESDFLHGVLGLQLYMYQMNKRVR